MKLDLWKKEIQLSPIAINDSKFINYTGYWFGRDDEPNFRSNRFNAKEKGYTDTDIVYQFNEYGYRSNPFDTFDSVEFKMLVVGCSHTMGIGLRLEDTWPTKLQRMIPNSILYNLSSEASSPDYCIRTIYNTIDIINPDAVFVLWPGTARFEIVEGDKINRVGPWTNPYPPILINEATQDYYFAKNKIIAQMICDNKSVPLYAADQTIYQNTCAYDPNAGGDQARDDHLRPSTHTMLAEHFFKMI